MNNHEKLSIKQWAEEDRPREKLILKGRLALSEAELLAILIGSGTSKVSAVDLAKTILVANGNDLNALAKLSIGDLKKFGGIGEAKAITIISALELGRRRKEQTPIKNPKVTSPQIAYEYLKPMMMDLDHEQFWVLYLNIGSRIVQHACVSTGGVNGTVIDARLVFKKAIELLASNVILAHNHPSGSLYPSDQDIRLTKQMKKAGEILGVSVVDHLIVTDQGFYSFREHDAL